MLRDFIHRNTGLSHVHCGGMAQDVRRYILKSGRICCGFEALIGSGLRMISPDGEQLLIAVSSPGTETAGVI